jgi:hypothetical protein
VDFGLQRLPIGLDGAQQRLPRWRDLRQSRLARPALMVTHPASSIPRMVR